MSEPVRKIATNDLVKAQGTPGLVRRTADETEAHWFGHVVAEAETISGWHHHGDNTTLGYVLSGAVTVEFGPDGQKNAVIGEGEYFVVPPNTIHREGNLASDDAEAVIVRYGQGPPVFPANGPE